MKFLSENFIEIEKRAGFPAQAKTVLEKTASELDSNRNFGDALEKIRKGFMYGKSDNFSPYVKKSHEIAEAYGVNQYTLDLVYVMTCCELLRKRYKRAGIPEQIYWDGINDLRCKLLECMECEHTVGSFVADWNGGFLKMNRFALGRFQYEYDTFDRDYTTKSGIVIKKGDESLNFHIPSSGIPLTDEIRMNSYKKAYDFFKDRRTKDGYLLLRCGSWLLYPEHEKFLDKNSNILRFLHDFEIYDWAYRDNFGDDWRIWGHYSDLPLEERPSDTKLRAAYKKWMMSGHKTGYGCGIILFDGEKIVT